MLIVIDKICYLFINDKELLKCFVIKFIRIGINYGRNAGDIF